MATVSDVTIKYAARGAKAAQKADERVRESIQETAKTARQESGTISRWMQRHRAALIGIGAASAAAMGAIIQNSPALQAEMATIRLGFSLLAMAIGQDLAPAFRFIGDIALDLAEAYRNLSPPIRTTISAIIGLVLAGGTLAGMLAGLQTLVQGTFVATIGSKAVTAIAGFISGSLALAAVVGAAIGLFVVWILEITGVLNWIGNLAQATRKLAGGPLTDLLITIGALTGIIPVLAVLGAAIVGLMRGGIPGAVAAGKKALSVFTAGVINTFDRMIQWVRSNAPPKMAAAILLVTNALMGELRKFHQWLIGGSFIPMLFRAVAEFIRNSGATLLSDAFGAAMDAARNAIQSVNPRQWGTDMMNELANGIQSAASSVESTAEGISEDIAEHIGFDNAANDRMARRWGSDLAQEFTSGLARGQRDLMRAAGGMRSGMGEAMTQTPAGAGNNRGGGGGPTVIRFERGAIRQRDDGSVEVDRRNVSEEQGSQFNARSNI